MSDTAVVNYQNPCGFEINFDLLQQFERGLNTQAPERSQTPGRVLGYGEISTVFEIQVEALRGLAFKRMAIFEKPEEFGRYLATYREYLRLLEEECGLLTPAHGYAAFVNAAGRPVFYIIQKQLPSEAFGHKALKALPRAGQLDLFRLVLRQLLPVWEFNRRRAGCEVAIDGQISNWAIEAFDPCRPRVDEQTTLLYLDTSTPLLRLQGVEQLDPELFLRTAPAYLVWLLRLLFLKDVMSRYYDFRKVVLDLVANFYKEQLPELIPDVLAGANAFFAAEAAALRVKPLDEKEVAAYYREDALIWSLYLSMRRFDRYTRTRLLGRHYPYLLPGPVRR